MRLDEPWWWYPAGREGARRHWPAVLLAPVAAIYGSVTLRRMRRTPLYVAGRPVVCIGNITVGGTGKTPTAIAIAGILAELGREAWFLSRGYGGANEGPHRVDPARDGAAAVGDEPLLLAAHAPVVVARDRAAGAQLIDATAPREAVIVMDDGLQNPSLAKDLTLCTVDHRRGFGNGLVCPAGPLRASIGQQLRHVDALILTGAPIGEQPAVAGGDPSAVFQGPVLRAAMSPELPDGGLAAGAYLAFTGIANPDRFFDMLRRAGVHLVDRRRFPDHHPFSERDAAELLHAAAAHDARLITTAKDKVRLRGSTGPLARLDAATETFTARMTFDTGDRQRLVLLLRRMIERRAAGLPAADG